MKIFNIKLLLGIALVLALAGCNQSSQDTSSSQSAAKYDVTATKPTALATAESSIAKQDDGDVRKWFIAHPRPLLESGEPATVLAANRSKQNARILVKELHSPSAMVYAPDGTLYFITSNENVVMSIVSGQNQSQLIMHSPEYSTVMTDEGKREPLYGYLGGLSLSKDGKLLTVINNQDPYQVDLKSGEMSFVPFVHPSGEKIIGVVDYNTADLKSYGDWEFSHIQSDMKGRIVLYNGGIHKWQRYRHGEKIEVINNPLELPAAAYLVEANPWEDIFKTVLGPDGYIYAVEEGQKPDAPDRIIRIGDSGLSSLRKEASRVTIAEFKHGELTGALAFSPKGELAVGAKNAIYLISPNPAK